MQLSLLAQNFAVCRLPADAPFPAELGVASLFAVTRTKDELSLVLPIDQVQRGWTQEGPWSCFKVAGPLDFALTGILAALTAPLAEAGISIFALSTYDTDYLMVKTSECQAAQTCLTAAGHSFT